MDVGIVGAGFGGCATALALARAGHRVTLLESVPAPQPVGAGIMLQPSGMMVLAELGVLPMVLEHGERCTRLRCTTAHGKRVFALDYSDRDPRLFGLGLHRGALFSALFDALPGAGVELRLDVTATALSERSIHDARGRTHGPFDLLVIADGARSRLRAALGHARRDQEYPWGALWFVAEDPARRHRGELVQSVAGTRAMLGLLPTGTRPGDATPYVSLFFSVKLGELAALRAAGLEAWKDRARALNADCEAVLAQITSLDQLLVATYRDVRMKRLDYGPIAYVGDAAHAMSPQLGQGSNLALLDALTLRDALQTHEKLEHALPAYSRARRGQLAYYQLVNRALTPFFQGDSRTLGLLRDALMPIAARFPPTRDLMVETMCGVRSGFLGRSLPVSPGVLALSAPHQTES